MISIIYSPEFLKHDTGENHPESPHRLTAVVEHLKQLSWASQIQWVSPNESREVMPYIHQVHNPKYVKLLHQVAHNGGGDLTGDTPMSSDSYDIALLAVKAWLDGVDRVITTHKQVFVLARPPGHHAISEYGMGFCLLSNAAIAAHYALSLPHIHRVAILDWDVHHGNGTQYIVESNPHIAYCSVHEFPCYPFTGKATETGKYHNVLNIPMFAGSALKEYQEAFKDKVIPFICQFQPDLLIISAGYDANELDPLASMSLHPQDYGVFTNYCLEITPKILFGLEGGYHLQALAQSVEATLASCLG